MSWIVNQSAPCHVLESERLMWEKHEEFKELLRRREQLKCGILASMQDCVEASVLYKLRGLKEL